MFNTSKGNITSINVGCFKETSVLRGQDIIGGLYNDLHTRCHFLGGFIRWMCSPLLDPVEAGDIDIYPKTMEDYSYIVGCINSHSRECFESPVAATFKATNHGRFAGLPSIQVIKPENKGAIVASGGLEDILNNFDFSVVRAGLLSLNTALVDVNFSEDEYSKHLRVETIHCPISSTLRMIKYGKKGYTTDATQIIKLFNDWDNRDTDYKESLINGIPKLSDDKNKLSEKDREKLLNLIYID
jgi:hypothetical protein